jgi:TorA maturation chaperone TorD
VTTGTKRVTSFADCLARATEYRLLHALLRPPAPGRREELRALARELPDAAVGPGLVEADDDEVAAEAFRLLGPAGPVSVCASDYGGDGYADKGPFLANVAGFYRAFGFEPAAGENPDHFASLFEFLGFLALKQAWAVHDRDGGQAEVAAEAEAKLASEYVHPYLDRFVERLSSLAPEGGAYAAIAAHLGSR